MRYSYFICDVFTESRFGGNPLAVLPEAEGLSAGQMQKIAREFNFSESTFVFPHEDDLSRRVRIFTPATEVPFAGHPNIGTAFVLATHGAFGDMEDSTTVTFEEKAGSVPVVITRQEGGALRCQLAAPERFSLGAKVSAGEVAAALSLNEEDILLITHQPQVASVGLPFLFAEVNSREALARAKADMDGIERLAEVGITPDIYFYTRSDDAFDIRGRMFAPLDGVPEDPATGSACCALAGLLSSLDDLEEGVLEWRIAQGVEMGRPSLLEVSAEKRGGEVQMTRVAGTSVMVSEGTLFLD